MTQIGTIKLQTETNGVVELPVFDTGSSGADTLECLRVQTGTGVGYVPLTDVSKSLYPYLRVQTGSGVKAVNKYEAGEIDEGDKEVWDVYANMEGSFDYEFASVSFSTNSDNIQHRLDYDSVVSDGTNASGRLNTATAGTVDLSNTETIYIEWEMTYSPDTSSEPNGTNAGFGADATQSNISTDKISNGTTEYGNVYKPFELPYSKRTDSLTIGTDPDPLYVGVTTEFSTDVYDRTVDIFIYDIWGEDANGNERWRFNLPDNLDGVTKSQTDNPQ